MGAHLKYRLLLGSLDKHGCMYAIIKCGNVYNLIYNFTIIKTYKRRHSANQYLLKQLQLIDENKRTTKQDATCAACID
jgi:hypothetical protein